MSQISWFSSFRLLFWDPRRRHIKKPPNFADASNFIAGYSNGIEPATQINLNFRVKYNWVTLYGKSVACPLNLFTLNDFHNKTSPSFSSEGNGAGVVDSVLGRTFILQTSFIFYRADGVDGPPEMERS